MSASARSCRCLREKASLTASWYVIVDAPYSRRSLLAVVMCSPLGTFRLSSMIDLSFSLSDERAASGGRGAPAVLTP